MELRRCDQCNLESPESELYTNVGKLAQFFESLPEETAVELGAMCDECTEDIVSVYQHYAEFKRRERSEAKGG